MGNVKKARSDPTARRYAGISTTIRAIAPIAVYLTFVLFCMSNAHSALNGHNQLNANPRSKNWNPSQGNPPRDRDELFALRFLGSLVTS